MVEVRSPSFRSLNKIIVMGELHFKESICHILFSKTILSRVSRSNYKHCQHILPFLVLLLIVFFFL